MNTRTFSRHWLKENRIGEDEDNPLVVDRDTLREDRGNLVRRVVLAPGDGTFWRLTYRERMACGADLDPWFDQDEVEAAQVHHVRRITAAWLAGDKPPARPGCRPNLPGSESVTCEHLADWTMACEVGGVPRRVELCAEHLQAAFRLRRDIVDICQVKRW